MTDFGVGAAVPGDETRDRVAEPPRDCPLCARLVAFRQLHRAREPGWHNAPVPTFGPTSAPVLVVGLAPGLRGANRTGRPFTGDYAGDLLYETMIDFGLATGSYEKDPADTLVLTRAAVTNAVRCVPPENKPTGEEAATCRPYLTATMAGQSGLQAILALGRIAHDQVLRAAGQRLAATPFAHGAVHRITIGGREVGLYDSYHCSRYNTNTGRLTREMFRAVFERMTADLA